MQNSLHHSAQNAEITLLLRRYKDGDLAAAHELIPLVYEELRRLARQHLTGQPHSLQPTMLVHEVFLHLFDGQPVDWQNRAHFFSIVSRQMRWLMVDHVRRATAQKRGGAQVKVPWDEAGEIGAPEHRPHELLLLDEALTQLEKDYPRAARIVELRYFVGLSEEQTAQALGLSVRTVRREWAFAKGWLFGRIRQRG